MISIIIPTLNEETTLEDTIKSVSPSNVEHEFIIVDAKSEDNTGTIANRYGKVLSIKEHSRGSSMDLGARHASGDILLFLHSDTHLPAGALEKIQKYMDNPEIVWGGFRGMPILEDVNLALRLRKSGQMILIKDCIRVSIRRYEKTGILKISLLNLMLTLFYICGVSPERIY